MEKKKTQILIDTLTTLQASRLSSMIAAFVCAIVGWKITKDGSHPFLGIPMMFFWGLSFLGSLILSIKENKRLTVLENTGIDIAEREPEPVSNQAPVSVVAS